MANDPLDLDTNHIFFVWISFFLYYSRGLSWLAIVVWNAVEAMGGSQDVAFVNQSSSTGVYKISSFSIRIGQQCHEWKLALQSVTPTNNKLIADPLAADCAWQPISFILCKDAFVSKY